jgi:hypothetical protein
MIGARTWAIGEGWLPDGADEGRPDELCILNAGAQTAEVQIMVYFRDRSPAGPYRVMVPAKRSERQVVSELTDPEGVPRGLHYSMVIQSTCPVVVQQTRYGSPGVRDPFASVMAYPVSDG